MDAVPHWGGHFSHLWFLQLSDVQRGAGLYILASCFSARLCPPILHSSFAHTEPSSTTGTSGFTLQRGSCVPFLILRLNAFKAEVLLDIGLNWPRRPLLCLCHSLCPRFIPILLALTYPPFSLGICPSCQLISSSLLPLPCFPAQWDLVLATGTSVRIILFDPLSTADMTNRESRDKSFGNF